MLVILTGGIELVFEACTYHFGMRFTQKTMPLSFLKYRLVFVGCVLLYKRPHSAEVFLGPCARTRFKTVHSLRPVFLLAFAKIWHDRILLLIISCQRLFICNMLHKMRCEYFDQFQSQPFGYRTCCCCDSEVRNPSVRTSVKIGVRTCNGYKSCHIFIFF